MRIKVLDWAVLCESCRSKLISVGASESEFAALLFLREPAGAKAFRREHNTVFAGDQHCSISSLHPLCLVPRR